MALEPFSGATAFMGKERAVYSFMALEPFAEATVFEGTEEAVYLFTALEPAMALEPFSGATICLEQHAMSSPDNSAGCRLLCFAFQCKGCKQLSKMVAKWQPTTRKTYKDDEAGWFCRWKGQWHWFCQRCWNFARCAVRVELYRWRGGAASDSYGAITAVTQASDRTIC